MDPANTSFPKTSPSQGDSAANPDSGLSGANLEQIRERITRVAKDWEHQLTDLLAEANALMIRQNAELRTISDSYRREVEQIQEIQESLLPQSIPEIPGIEFASHYLPTTEASGDYYDFLDLSAHHTGVLVADVSGHGAAAAVVMAITRVLAQAHLTQLLQAGGALSVLNSLMARFIPGDQFVTAVYGIYNRLNHAFDYATAGHPAPIHWSESKQAATLLPIKPRFPLRLFDEVAYETLTCRIEPGDAIVLYTDGLTELTNAKDEMVGESLLTDWVSESPSHSAAGILWHLLDQASLYTQGIPPRDDFTIVVLRRTE
jgi:sigma-B regulation protein RsbU (phosphoserine phosphatase)